MPYRVEFMLETTEEHSVCAMIACGRSLDKAVRAGFANAGLTQVEHGAGGFQVRDMDNGQIVAIEEFTPMGNA